MPMQKLGTRTKVEISLGSCSTQKCGQESMNCREEWLKSPSKSLTKASIIENLVDQRDKAAAAGQYTAAIRANELLGKGLGMFVERTEISRGNRSHRPRW